MKCICDAYDKLFELTHDTQSKEPPKSYISISSCESGGIYDVHICCPYYNNNHDLT